MKARSFSLRPFPSEKPRSQLNVSCRVSGRAEGLSLSYSLLGPLEGILVPGPAPSPSRRYGLWEETCFEFFVGTKNSDKYWEFNLSPAGDWNVYLFTSYREGMREEPAFTSLPMSVHADPEGLRLSLKLDLRNIIPAGQVLTLAISAVIREIDGNVTHWALVHPGRRPDFHQRGSFIVGV